MAAEFVCVLECTSLAVDLGHFKQAEERLWAHWHSIWVSSSGLVDQSIATLPCFLLGKVLV